MTTRPIERINLALSAGVVATAAAVASPLFAMSVAIGALVEGLSFRGLSIASRAFFAGVIRGQTAWLVLLAMRLGLVGALLYGAVRLGIDPIGLLLGLSVILPASVLGAIRMRPAIDPNAGPVEDEPADTDWGWDARLYRDREDSP